uniref:Uncharacterized protein n=1 Tax=Meloidogyne enterolobii TaxID=390850 RepID=A0A6V7WIN9_MELEN|nr:unnamed protein product [Meloidogyne enterolobii]
MVGNSHYKTSDWECNKRIETKQHQKHNLHKYSKHNYRVNYSIFLSFVCFCWKYKNWC